MMMLTDIRKLEIKRNYEKRKKNTSFRSYKNEKNEANFIPKN